MRVSTLLPLLTSIPALAAPSFLRLPDSPVELATQAFDSAQSWLSHALSGGHDKLDDFVRGIEGEVNAEFVAVHDIECMSLRLTCE